MTFTDFIELDRDEIPAVMDESVEINPNGYLVVEQLWGKVGELMSYTSRLVEPLFDTVGVAAEEKSPFCRIFLSATNLREKFITYPPRTFLLVTLVALLIQATQMMRLVMLPSPCLKQFFLNELGCLQTKY